MAIGEIVLGSFLASFFQILFDKLSSLTLSYAQQEGFNTTLLEEWKGMLLTINAVLVDAEDKQLSNNPLVKLWLDDVRDLAYDMEDLLDELVIKITQVESEAKSSTSKGLEKWKSSFFGQDKSSRLNPNFHSLVSETKVQEVNGRLKAIVTRKAHLSLRENVADKSNYTNKRDPTTSLSEPQFFGREKEEAQILELLISEVENSNAMLSIVPIVGMGGVGKTALAQRTTLRSITGLSNEGEDLNELQVKLKDSLYGKKFLVVLDDIWNEKYEKWTALLKPFEAGAKGSKIIITTRNLHVASITRASPYPLRELSFDNCVSLLAFHALEAINFESHPAFEMIGKKIAERCKGLPLASKMLGGVLRTKSNPDEWEDTLNNKIWDLPTAENDEVLPILKLSYVHLPSHLKRCFAYCAIFPKDYEIERDELVLLWMADGLLDGQKAKENNLRLGRNYFDELVSRSFLQQSSVYVSKFSMHDLLNDLAKSIAGGTCFSSGESQLAINEDEATPEKARYASFISSKFVTSKCLRAYHRMKALRSLMLLGGNFYISNKVLHDLLIELKYLRVLSICHCDIVEVPNCVGNLKNHELEAQVVDSLRPHTNLENLTILNYGGAIFPSWLDSPSFSKMVSVCLLGCPNVMSLPSLGQLPSLKELSLEGLHAVTMIGSEFYGGKRPFSSLTTLELKEMLAWKDWSPHAEDLKEEFPFSCLQHLVVRSCPSLVGTLPCQLDHLIKLEIHSCPHLNNSTSVVRLPSLRELYLENCNNEILKSLVNLTSLTILRIENLAQLVCFVHEFMSCLVKLKELHIGGCDKLKYLWQDGNEMLNLTCLHELAIKSCPQFTSFVAAKGEMELPCNLERMELINCPSLEKLPSKMHTLRHLDIQDCPKLTGQTIHSYDPSSNNTISQLEYLRMIRCDALTSFPFAKGRLVALKKLTIWECKGLKSLEEITIQSLEEMTIGGWCENMKQPMREWGLPLLTSLEFLIIDLSMGGEGEKEWFPSEEDEEDVWNLLFPSSLIALPDEKNEERGKISGGFRNQLSSLKHLGFVDCPKLRKLPEDGLPPSLQSLEIKRCEILEDRCSKLTGDNWPLIQDIPYIGINYSRIR
ncbi:putative disease resistance RPP13-like protein 1 [Eucalyptus grandis]|uniref:putative disease resistance RPP13-like protein 1 n=1 Tax=Eucalyptus grandis TaxID=71139 RepID=UPI00192EC8ED|nr:putative disease resistance RPP13-like protein 1 [Eucalyptus grandis]